MSTTDPTSAKDGRIAELESEVERLKKAAREVSEHIEDEWGCFDLLGDPDTDSWRRQMDGSPLEKAIDNLTAIVESEQ